MSLKQINKLIDWMDVLVKTIEHGPVEPPSHHCGGPNSCCGGECVDWSRQCEMLDEVKKMIKEWRSENEV